MIDAPRVSLRNNHESYELGCIFAQHEKVCCTRTWIVRRNRTLILFFIQITHCAFYKCLHPESISSRSCPASWPRNYIFEGCKMVKTSGIREKHRSNILKNLAKRLKTDPGEKDAAEEEEEDHEDLVRRSSKAKSSSSSNLLSMLPAPKNACPLGPTVRLDKLLEELVDKSAGREEDQEGAKKPEPNESGIIEVNMSKELDQMAQNAVRDFTLETGGYRAGPKPERKEKQKNQITYLARLGKETEVEQKEKAALSRANKAAARSKYGW